MHDVSRDIVFMGPDEGHRDLDNLYNDDYLTYIDDWSWTVPEAPI